MKSIILAVLAALTIGLTGTASADLYSWDRNGAFPQGTVQVNAE